MDYFTLSKTKIFGAAINARNRGNGRGKGNKREQKRIKMI